MLSISFQTSMIAVAQIFAMGAVGYALVKRRIVTEEGLKLLSFLSINILFPLFIFNQIISNFDMEKIPFWWGFPLINMGLIALGLGITFLLVRHHPRPLKTEFLASTSFHNAGYIPTLLAMSLPLGAMAGEVYAAVIISIVGFDLCLWSVGVWLMTKSQSPHMDLKNLINPPLLSMLVAFIIVLIFGPHPIPESFLKPVKILGDGALAIAMLVIGGNLAFTKILDVDVQRVTGVVLIKLILLPLLVMVVLATLHLNPLISFVVMIQASMPTAVTLSVIGRNYGTKNQEFINQSIFFTHVLSMVTIPIFLGLYGKLVN